MTSTELGKKIEKLAKSSGIKLKNAKGMISEHPELKRNANIQKASLAFFIEGSSDSLQIFKPQITKKFKNWCFIYFTTATVLLFK